MAAIATLTDDFSGSFNTSKWTAFLNGGTAAVSNVSGRCRVAHDYATDTGKTGFYSASNYEFAGSSFYWRFYPPAASADAHKITTQVGVVHSNLAHKEGVGFKFQNTSLQFLIWNNFDDEWQVEAAAAVTYSSVDHAWLRVRESASTFYWDTAPDNSGVPGTWTQRASYSRTGANVSFDDMTGFMGTGGAKAYFRVFHWDATFTPGNLTSHLEIDGVNGPLVSSVTHATTGVLAAAGARTVASSARNIAHATSGVLAAPQGPLVGSAARNVAHATSGALEGLQGASTGAASRSVVHATSGALAGAAGGLAQPRQSNGELRAGLSVMTGRASRTNPANLESIQDAFDAAAVDTTNLWDVVADVGTSAAQSDGKLVLTVNTADGYRYVSVTSKAAKRLTGNRVYTRMTDAITVPNNVGGAEAGLRVMLDDSNYFNWLQNSDGTLQAQHSVAGSYSVTVLSYTPATHAWLAFSERGGTVYWESAPSSAQDPPLEGEWVTRFSAAPGFAITAVKLRLTAGVYDPATTGVPSRPAQFDSVNTQTRGPVAHATSGALVAPGALVLGAAAKRIIHDAIGSLTGAIGRLPSGAHERYRDHPSAGVLGAGSAIMSGIGSTSDATRKVWFEAQDTGGAWINPPAPSDDPWTPRPDSDTSWST